MTELSIKELKALLDENDLDLSMRQLTVIPAKALSKIPRATHLDFSNNLISIIPTELCYLTHLTKLDLSNNRISCLPDEFGKLVNLAHLDLYRNEIEELPLSFGELSSLRWLDLKNNPLETELAKAAGDCSDEKGCKQAAINVVRLMRARTAQHQRLSEKQKADTMRFEENEAIGQGLVAQKEKPKKKKHKLRDSVSEQQEPALLQVEQNGPEMLPAMKHDDYKARTDNGAATRKRGSSCAAFMWKVFVFLFVCSLVLSGFVIATVVSNCVSDSRYWMPSSRPFCKDLHQMLTKHSFPPSVAGNFFLAVASLLISYGQAAGEAWNNLRRSELMAPYNSYIDALYLKLVSIALLVQGYVMHMYDDFEAFYKEIAADIVNDAVRNLWLLLRIFGLMLADLLIFIADKGLLFISSIVETIFTYAHRSEELLGLWET